MGITYGRDKNTSRRLGFCILEFEEQISVKKVLERGAHYVLGKKIKV
jgi:hypothetical protein